MSTDMTTRRQAILSAIGAFFGLKCAKKIGPVICDAGPVATKPVMFDCAPSTVTECVVIMPGHEVVVVGHGCVAFATESGRIFRRTMIKSQCEGGLVASYMGWEQVTPAPNSATVG